MKLVFIKKKGFVKRVSFDSWREFYGITFQLWFYGLFSVCRRTTIDTYLSGKRYPIHTRVIQMSSKEQDTTEKKKKKRICKNAL